MKSFVANLLLGVSLSFCVFEATAQDTILIETNLGTMKAVFLQESP